MFLIESENCPMEAQIKTVNTPEEKASVLSIRRAVFIQGLDIPEHIEIDENEDAAHYVLAEVENTPVGTARWRQTKEGIKLERFAVLHEYRSLGIGKQMTEFILDHMPNDAHIYLNSQDTAIGFYEKLGFQSVGPLFEEAGIQHQQMIFSRNL